MIWKMVGLVLETKRTALNELGYCYIVLFILYIDGDVTTLFERSFVDALLCYFYPVLNVNMIMIINKSFNTFV